MAVCRADRIKHILKYMEYEMLTDKQLDLIVSFESQFEIKGYLTDSQFETLESIFKQAAERY